MPRATSSPRPRGRTRCSCRSPAGPSTGADEDWWGDFVPSRASCWRTPASTRGPSTPWPRAPSAPACCRWTPRGKPLMNAVLYGVDTRASAQIAALNARIGEDGHPGALRQCADLAVGRAQDPVAEGDAPRPLRAHRQGPDLDQLPRLEADRRVRHRPLHGRQLLAALRRRTGWTGRPTWRPTSCPWTACRGCCGRPRSPATSPRPPRPRPGLAEGTPVTVGTIDAAAEAVSVGRPGTRRDDADVWLDHLHHPGHRSAGPRPAAVVCALARPRDACLDGGPRDLRHADPLVPRPAGPGRETSASSPRRQRRAPRAPRACSACPISRASGRRSTTRRPRAPSSAST